MTENLLNLIDACQNTGGKTDFEALRQAITEQAEQLALAQEDEKDWHHANAMREKAEVERDALYAKLAEIEKTRHLVGYYHKAETADECDFYFLDAINGDCPDCHPCYADTAALEKPALQGSGLPLSIKDTTHDEKDWHYVNDRLEKADLEVARLKAACDKMSEDEMLAKLDVNADLLLREIFALCESTENECAGRLDSFKQGRAFEAKRIRQSIGTWHQDTFCGPSFMGEPVAHQPVNEELVLVAKAFRSWIDAVPQDTVLPAMPGIDRDWADTVIARAARAEITKSPQCTPVAEPAQTKTIEVPATEANNYSRILSLLELEEEGDPVAKIESLQADAARYRLGREAEYTGLMPTFRTGKTWTEAMDAAYDAAIEAARKEI